MTEQELIQENEKLNARLQKAVQVFAEQKANITKLTTRVEELEAAQSNDSSDNSEIDALNSKINELEFDIEGYKTDIDKLKNELEEAKSTTVDSTELDETKKAYKDLQEKSLVDTLTISTLKKEAEIKDGEVARLNERLTKATESYNEQKATIDELNRVVSDNNDALEEIMSERDQLKESNASIYSEYAEKIRSLENELCEANEKLEEMEQTPQVDVSAYEAKLEKARQTFAESKEKIASMTETINTVVAEKNELVEQISTKDEEIKTLKESIKEYEPIVKEVNTYKDKVEKLEEAAKNAGTEREKSITLLEDSEKKRQADAKKYEAEIARQGTFINKLIEQITGPLATAVASIGKANDDIQHMYGSFKKG